MRILQISSARTLGGGERHMADLSNALTARGHEVYVALNDASPLRDELDGLPPARIITLPLRHALDVPTARRLARFIRDERIDILHAHVARDYPLAAFARKLAPRAHLVVTRHVLFPVSRLTALMLRHAARIIAVSESVAHALRARPFIPSHNIAVIPNGINFARFDASLRDFKRDEYRRLLTTRARLLVGTVGELSRVKGQENFLRAAAIVARASDEVEFLIAGADASPKGETRAQLQNLIADLQLQDRAHLLGRRDDVAQILSSLDVFVSASRSEAFGLAIVEAMACGVPVVATATEGAREIINDGTTGQLVPIDNPEALADAILALLRSPHERTRLSAQARVEARARFGLTRMVEATEAVYNACLQTR